MNLKSSMIKSIKDKVPDATVVGSPSKMIYYLFDSIFDKRMNMKSDFLILNRLVQIMSTPIREGITIFDKSMIETLAFTQMHNKDLLRFNNYKFPISEKSIQTILKHESDYLSGYDKVIRVLSKTSDYEWVRDQLTGEWNEEKETRQSAWIDADAYFKCQAFYLTMFEDNYGYYPDFRFNFSDLSQQIDLSSYINPILKCAGYQQ